MTPARLQIEHHLCQAFMRHYVPNLLFVRLRNLIVLAVDTAQIAVSKEDVAGPARAGQRRLFPKVWGVRRNDRQSARIARGDFVLQSVIETVARTNRATPKQSFQRIDAPPKFAATQQAKIAGFPGS